MSNGMTARVHVLRPSSAIIMIPSPTPTAMTMSPPAIQPCRFFVLCGLPVRRLPKDQLLYERRHGRLCSK
jgi:hypothetical protein